MIVTHRLGPDEVSVAAEILHRGGTLGLPTETVYGLAADASRADAVAKVFEAKGRPAGHPLIVHVSCAEAAEEWGHLDQRARALAEAWWPGPLTLVVPRTDRVAEAVVGGRPTIGLRVPSHPVASAVLDAFGGGVAAPSANRFGHVSPTTVDHVLADLGGRIDAVIDGGPTTVGVESTIVELVDETPRLLRPGGISVDQVRAVLDCEIVDDRSGRSRAAGMMASHYAPRASVEVTVEVEPGMLGPTVGVIGPVTIEHPNVWLLPGDAGGYANGLYAAMRAADEAGMQRLLIVPPSTGPLTAAVLDRLHKAAAR